MRLCALLTHSVVARTWLEHHVTNTKSPQKCWFGVNFSGCTASFPDRERSARKARWRQSSCLRAPRRPTQSGGLYGLKASINKTRLFWVVLYPCVLYIKVVKSNFDKQFCFLYCCSDEEDERSDEDGQINLLSCVTAATSLIALPPVLLLEEGHCRALLLELQQNNHSRKEDVHTSCVALTNVGSCGRRLSGAPSISRGSLSPRPHCVCMLTQHSQGTTTSDSLNSLNTLLSQLIQRQDAVFLSHKGQLSSFLTKNAPQRERKSESVLIIVIIYFDSIISFLIPIIFKNWSRNHHNFQEL